MKKSFAIFISIILFATPSSVMSKENRLSKTNSPYLRLHKDNPIDWYEWGEEAFDKARREDKPLLISIGYFSCHWCHVMNEETFMDPEVGRMLNELFVCVKVDRQERPDLDEVYMTYLRMTSGSGGWPMTIFATPDGVPFFGGAFFPPRDDMGMPGLLGLGPKVAEFYKNEKHAIAKNSKTIMNAFDELYTIPPADELDTQLPEKALEEMRILFDEEMGGFGIKPKFPNELNLLFILDYEKSLASDVEMVRLTLEKMAEGGIHDQIGGGFHRYAVDEKWRTPHFEKMLFTNAAIMRLYTAMSAITGDGKYLDVAMKTGRYLLEEMYRPGGGFYSAQDADSPGGEGAFYLWTRDEIIDILGEKDGVVVADHLGIKEIGSFEGLKSAPRIAKPVTSLAKERGEDESELGERIDAAKEALYQTRAKRPAPPTEKSVIASWSAAAARGFVSLYNATGTEEYLAPAIETLSFIESRMKTGGALRHSFINGKPGEESYVEDYAEVIAAWLDLFEATQEADYLSTAERLANEAEDLFGGKDENGFYMTPKDIATPLGRRKSYFDSSTASGAALMAHNFSRLYALTGKRGYRALAIGALKDGQGSTKFSVMNTATYLTALSAGTGGMSELALVGKGSDLKVKKALREIRGAPIFNRAILLIDTEKPGSAPEVHNDKKPVNGEPTLYVCRNFACDEPVPGYEAILKAIDKMSVTAE